jgi:hypothetical protein
VTTTMRPPRSWTTPEAPSISLYDLVDACEKPGCPLCRIGRDAAFDSVDALLYENVTDAGVRTALRASWGLCPDHVHLPRSVANGAAGVSILYEDFLDRAARRLDEAAAEADRTLRGGESWTRFARARPGPLVAREGSCPACDARRDAEARALAALLDHWSESRTRAAYAVSVGLCLPHLEAAWAAHAAHPNLGLLLQDARQRVERLQAELAEFVRKLDYRHSHEAIGPEGSGWLRALDWFGGSRPDPEPRASRASRNRQTPHEPDDEAPSEGERGAHGELRRRRGER